MVSLKSSTETQVASQVLTQSLSTNTVIPGQWGCDLGGLLIQAYTRIVFSKYTVGLWYLWVPHLWIEATTVVDYAIHCWLNPRMLTRGYRGTTVGLEHMQILVPTADPRTSVPWIGY